jgi:hypothetical protein
VFWLFSSSKKAQGDSCKAEWRKPPGEIAIANALDRTARAVPLQVVESLRTSEDQTQLISRSRRRTTGTSVSIHTHMSGRTFLARHSGSTKCTLHFGHPDFITDCADNDPHVTGRFVRQAI